MGEGIMLRGPEGGRGGFEGLRSDGVWGRVTSGAVRPVTREEAEDQARRMGLDPSVLAAPPAERPERPADPS